MLWIKHQARRVETMDATVRAIAREGHAARTLALIVALAAVSIAATDAPRPATARDVYNAGTIRLREGKLREAEDLLRSAAASNDRVVTPAALFNLGHTRFQLGDAELARIAAGGQAREQPDRAIASAQAAAQSARLALAEDDIDALVRAYRRGAGARRELRAAREAVKESLEQFGRVLLLWERAAGDFHGAHELRLKDTNALSNASIVDRRIAELIDIMKKQQDSMSNASQAGDELKDLMQEMRKRVPKDQSGQLGDEGEDDDWGDEEEQNAQGGGGGRDPKSISQQQAAQLLQSMQLDSGRTLSPQGGPSAAPSQRAGGDW